MKKVLLIWEEIGGDNGLKAYLLPDLTKEELDILKDINLCYINIDDDPKILRKLNMVNDWLCSIPEYCETPELNTNCKWSKYKTDFPIIDTIEAVYTAGFCL